MDLKELALVDPRTHWYYQSKLAGIRRILGPVLQRMTTIVDVGAGSGFFSIALASELSDARVICIDPNYEDLDAIQQDDVRFVRHANSEDLAAADAMLFIDVLEHVDDAQGLLQSYVNSAKSGCFMVISVPAFMSLWSPHDEFLEHKHRYTLQEIEGLARSTGLRVVRGRYLFASIVGPVWASRRLRRSQPPASDLKPVPRWINQLLKSITSLEHRVTSTRVAGLSAVVLAEVTLDERRDSDR